MRRANYDCGMRPTVWLKECPGRMRVHCWIAGGVDKFVRLWPWPAAAAAQPVAAEKQWEFAAPIRSLHVSADGNRVVLGGDDRVVRVWDLTLGRELERFPAGHAAAISDVAVSADGKTVVSGSSDKTARLVTLSLAHVAVAAEARAVAFLPDGSQLVSAGTGTSLTRWKLGDTALENVGLIPPAAAPGFVPAKQVELTLRADGKQLASLDESGRVNVWEVAADIKLAFVIPPADPLPPGTPRGSLHYSADNTKLVVGHASRLRVFDATNGRLLQQFTEPTAVAGVSFAPDNLTLLVGRVGPQNNAALRQLSLERLIPFAPPENFPPNESER